MTTSDGIRRQTGRAVQRPLRTGRSPQIRDAIARDHTNYQRLRDAVGELQAKEEQTPASKVRLGVCLYLLGRYYRAIEVLKQADGGAMAHFYLAKAYFAREQYAGGRRELPGRRAGRLRRRACALGRAEALRYAGNRQRGPGRARRPLRRHRADRRISLPARRHRGRHRRQSRRKSWPCTSGPSRPIATIPAPCSAWPWKTTAAATTTRPWNCTSGRPAISPPTSARC